MSILNARTLFSTALLGAAVALTGLAGTVNADHHGGQETARAVVGQKAPTFTLKDTDGKEHSLQKYLDEGKIVVLEWFNPECPFVVKHHDLHPTMASLAKKYAEHNVVWMAINSGREGQQGAGLEKNQQYKSDWEISYPILMDMSGDVGRKYNARTTPHMFIIHSNGTLMYDGAIDNNRSPRELGDINYVDNALRAILAGETVEPNTTRPYGCSVKY